MAQGYTVVVDLKEALVFYLAIMVIALIAVLIFGLRAKSLNRQRMETLSQEHNETREREWELIKKRYGHPYPKRNVVVMDDKNQSERVDIYKEEHKS